MRRHCVWHWRSSCTFSIRREPSLPDIRAQYVHNVLERYWLDLLPSVDQWRFLDTNTALCGTEWVYIGFKTGASVPSGVSDGIAVRCEYFIASAGLFWFGTNAWAKIICFLPRKDSIVPAQMEISPWFKWSCFSSCSSMNFSSRKS